MFKLVNIETFFEKLPTGIAKKEARDSLKKSFQEINGRNFENCPAERASPDETQFRALFGRVKKQFEEEWDRRNPSTTGNRKKELPKKEEVKRNTAEDDENFQIHMIDFILRHKVFPSLSLGNSRLI